MKRNFNRLLSLALALVMLVGILPLSTIVADAAASNLTGTVNTMVNPEVIFHQDFENDEVDTVLTATAPNTQAGKTVRWINNMGANDSATVNEFDPNYGKSIKAVCGEGATGTRQYYFEMYNQYTFSKDKAYRFEVDVHGTLTGGIFGGFWYVEGASSSAGSDGNLSVNAITTTGDGGWSHLAFDLQPTQNHCRVRFTLCVAKSTIGTVYFDNLKITEYTPVSDVTEISNYTAAENNTIILCADADLTGTDLVVASGSSLDLNGNKLTANSVTSADSGKIIDSSNAEGCVNASLVCDDNNPYLPLNTGAGYILVQPKMDDTYVKTSHDVNGFEIALRPGFGKFDGDKSVREHILSQSNAGVTLTVSVAWKDVYGQTGEKTVKAFTDEEFTQVYSSTSGKYFYTKFTNPGESQYYDVTLTLVSNGVRVSRTLHFNNLAEVNKTYLFAHNFDGISEYSRDDKSYYYLDSMRGEFNYIKTDKAYAIPTLADGALYMNGADKANQIWLFGIPSHDSESKAVVTFKFRVMLDSSDSYNRSGFTLMDIRSTPRMTLASANTGANKSGQFNLYEKNAEGSTVKNHYIGQALTPDVWYDVEIVMDYANDTISLAIGENVVSTTLAEFAFSKDAYASQYFLMTRTAAHDQYFLDDLRLSYTNG